ncbi:hypothetical protein ABMA27_013616 [Loxostege sticticalis]|uniref:Uncharacterized protein n=1 Tax=Loxostege sticticalis TaxID=481309 RepID=A0ABR3IFY4_LOXSC
MMEAVIFLTLFIGFCHAGDKSCFEYPCGQDDIDISCVRDFLLKKCECKSSCHSDGKPIHLKNAIAYVPNVDLSVDVTDAQTTYYGSKIIAFYLNTKTDRLVLAVDYSGLGLDSPTSYFQIARKAQEPLEVKDYVNVTYAATLTAHVPWGPHGLVPEDVTVTAYITDPMPCYKLGPCVTENPLIQETLTRFLADRETSVKELFLTKAYYFFWIWLQNYACDFGYQYNGDIRY